MTRLISIALLLSGCVTVRGRAAVPHPHIDMPRLSLSLGLDLSSVRDRFTIPEQSGVRAVDVEGWRATLRAGFRNGPAPFFATSDSPDYTLRFLRVDPDFQPTVVNARTGGAAAVAGHLFYMAQLVDRAGNIAARIKGEAWSTSSWTSYESEKVTAEAVAKMYEDIADQHLASLASAAPAPAGAPSPVTAASVDEAPPVIEKPVRYELQRRTPLMIAGAAAFGGGWALSAVFVWLTAGLIPCNGCYLIPLAGPLVAAGLDRGPNFGAWLTGTILSAAQVAGLTLLAIGVFTRRQVEISDDEEATARAGGGTVRWSFAPFASTSSLGVSLVVTH